MGGKNELRFVLALQQGFHYLLVDGLAIQIVLRLVNDDEVIVAHGKGEQDQCRGTLSNGVFLNRAALIEQLKMVRALVSEELCFLLLEADLEIQKVAAAAENIYQGAFRVVIVLIKSDRATTLMILKLILEIEVYRDCII